MSAAASPYGNAASHTIGDGVYLSLRKNIVNLNLKPGEALNVKAISEKLGVSRTPVRDAFIKLEKEGLVDVVPQKGTSVSKIDVKRVDEEKFIRESLEEKAVELFMRDPQASAITRLSSNLQIQRECVQRNDCLTFLDYDDDFHGIIFQTTGKELSWNLIQNMSGHYRRVRLMSLWDCGVLSGVLNQHEAILQQIQATDLDSVLARLKEHFTKIFYDERNLMRAYPDYFKEQASNDFLMKDFLSAM
jgi:GntR family transcriptional regulator, rspAB operon transcriptional repressor